MRYTLKELVDIILSAMDSDEVNSITDTVESNQVALLLKSVYYDIATDLGLPEHDTLFELTASGDSSKPVLMTLPTTVARLDTVSYDNRAAADTNVDYSGVQFLTIKDFIDRQQGLREHTTGVAQMEITLNGDTFSFMHHTDRFPSWYTVIGDNSLVFDAYDSDIDATLQSDKTVCEGSLYPTFTLSDTFTPDLDPTQFSYYLNKAKVRAFAELKQVANVEASEEARRQRIVVQNRMRRSPEKAEVQNVARYGRK